MTSAGRALKVAIVGLGNIGFRHLQGLATSKHAIDLFGVEPTEAGRDRAIAEWRRLRETPIHVGADFSVLPRTCDVVVIATPATNRLTLLSELLSATKPAITVLEKVVFQRLADFDAAAELARLTGTKLFVNCPRRMWPFYQSLKAEGYGSDVEIRIAWRDLGLACNAVHFIDALQFLSGTTAVQLARANLGDIVESKRPGYFEVFGTLGFETATGCRLVIDVWPDAPALPEMLLSQRGSDFALTESLGRILPANSSAPLIDVGRAPYQSELTGLLVDAAAGGMPLPIAGLDESRGAHAALFKALEPHFLRAGKLPDGGLPIT